MSFPLLLSFLLLGSPALAESPKQDAIQAETSGSSEPDSLPLADQPAVENPEDGLWTWIERMDGEVPNEPTLQALEELEDEVLSEAPVMEQMATVDVPTDFYADPQKVLTPDPLFLDQVDPNEFDIPVEVNDEVKKWVAYFNGPGRTYYARWLERSSAYRPMMYRELDKRGMPRDLVYLSMIESGYNAHAYSHAHAAGLWQFIPSTGRLYDLRIDWWVDDRRDPYKSTIAACNYLSELNDLFDGDWRMAWAAYNTGPGRVRRSMKKANSDSFWDITPHLHPETRNYVPKLMAAAIVGKHPERYGFTGIDYDSEFTYDAVAVDGSVEVDVLAKTAGMSVSDFQRLNPGLRRWASPPEGYEVRVPAGQAQTFEVALAAVPKNKRVSYTRHRVARGETLSAIAGRYGVSVDDISKASGLRNVNRIYVGMELVIPTGGSSAAVASSRAASSAPSKKVSKPSSYEVRSGDTLSGIATRYGVSSSDLRAWNGLKGSTIYAGQTLVLRSDDGGRASGGTTTVSHTVGAGETLIGIANKYGVSSSDLQKWNSIKNASHIQVGQRLTVHTGGGSVASSWTTYTVKAGDSLGRIASRNGCTVAELKSWNQITGSTIFPGQKLKIRG